MDTVTDAAPRPVVNADWWRPKRCTCSVWAAWQRFQFGGWFKPARNPNMPLPMFRVFWSPDGEGKEWWAYVPLHPKKPGADPWYAIWWDSLWFAGSPRLEKRSPMPFSRKVSAP